MRVCLFTLLLVTFLTLFAFNRGNCATRLTEDFTELVKLADAVVEATITEQKTISTDGTIYTQAAISILKVHKGEVPSQITVVYPGGFDGELLHTASGAPRLTPGTTVVLLLAKDARGWRVLAGDAGQVNLSQNSDGEGFARRASGKFVYYEADPGSLSGSTRIEGAAITLKTLRALVRSIVATGRPVIESTAVNQPEQSVASSPTFSPTEKLAVHPPSPEHPANHPTLRASLGILCLLGTVWFVRNGRKSKVQGLKFKV